jgi:hypothetical protein
MTELDEMAKAMTDLSISVSDCATHLGYDIIEESEPTDDSHMHCHYILTPLQRRELARENNEKHMKFANNKLKRRK